MTGAGLPPAPGGHPSYVGPWLDSIQNVRTRETYERAYTALAAWARQVRRLDVLDLTADDLGDWFDVLVDEGNPNVAPERRVPVSSNSLRTYRAGVGSLYKHCLAQQLITVNPMLGKPWRRRDHRRDQVAAAERALRERPRLGLDEVAALRLRVAHPELRLRELAHLAGLPTMTFVDRLHRALGDET